LFAKIKNNAFIAWLEYVTQSIICIMKLAKKYEVPYIIYFLWLTLLVSALISFITADWLALFLSLATFSLSLLAIYYADKSDFQMPSVLITSSILFIYGTLFLGEVANLYEKLWWWDVALHSMSALGFGLLGVIICVLVFRYQSLKKSPLLASILAFSFAMSIGAVWEIFEFSMDQLFDLNMQKSGLPDTMLDLIVDAIGATIAAVAGYLYIVKKNKQGLNAIIHEAVKDNKQNMS